LAQAILACGSPPPCGLRGGMATRTVGTVERFLPRRGFGLINPSDGGPQVFIHWSHILSEDNWAQLQPGMEVEYDLVTDSRGKRAAQNLTLPGGGAIAGAEDPNKSMRNLSRFTVTGEVLFFKRDLVSAQGSSCNLSKGMRVQFKVYKPQDKDSLAAAEVTDESGDPLVCELPPKGKGKGKGKDFGGKDFGKGGGGSKGSYNTYNTFATKGSQGGAKGGWASQGNSDSYTSAWTGSTASPGVQKTIQKPPWVSKGNGDQSKGYSNSWKGGASKGSWGKADSWSGGWNQGSSYSGGYSSGKGYKGAAPAPKGKSKGW